MSLPPHPEKFDTFVKLIARLRGPGGCPWDKEQTHRSLRENLLSETYEVLEALDAGEAAKLQEELGDLLLQIVLQAQIAKDSDEFEISDVIKGITEKIVRRHPHIFGEVKVKDAKDVMHNWEALKKEERKEGASMLESVPGNMPALVYAYEISRRAVRVGFEWPDLQGVLDKLLEEVNEIKEAATREEKAAEIGDLLFTMVNFARWQDIDPEAALREANRKFYRRFSKIEELCRQRGRELPSLTLKEWDGLWEEVKKMSDI